MRTDKYINHNFESSTVKTSEFKSFARAFKGDIKELIQNDFELVSFNTGHFQVSGFLKFNLNENYIYFSISDVRHFPNKWKTNILIRKAEHDKDFSGGSNNFTTLENFKHKAVMLAL
jgi:hypothetical protein